MLGDLVAPCPKEYKVYSIPFDPARGHHGGASIYVRHDVPHSMYTLNSQLQVVAVTLFLQRHYTVCSIYLPPNEDLPDNDLTTLLQEIPRPFLLLGDFNGRHPLWGDIITNTRGNILSTIIERAEVSILNTGEPTHFHVQTGTLSAIDLSICSPDTILDFDWCVNNDRHTSDHFPIIIRSVSSPPQCRLPKWNLRRANWSEYRKQSSVDANAEEFATIDDAVEFLNTTLYSAALQCIPRTTGAFQRKPLPWWNNECRSAHRTMRAAFTRYRHHKCDHYLVEYRKVRAAFRHTIKKARKESWSSFLNSINSKTPLSLVWKKVRKIAGKFVPSSPPVLQINGATVADPKSVANSLASHFAEVSKRHPQIPYAQYRQQQERQTLDFSSNGGKSYNAPFSSQELNSALSECSDSAPGPDDIPYAFIKRTSDDTRTFILSIINKIFTDHCFPSVWEYAIVLAFAKPGKDGSLPGSYRPIALTCCLCKLMEKMVNVRLVWYLERNKIISPAPTEQNYKSRSKWVPP